MPVCHAAKSVLANPKAAFDQSILKITPVADKKGPTVLHSVATDGSIRIDHAQVHISAQEAIQGAEISTAEGARRILHLGHVHHGSEQLAGTFGDALLMGSHERCGNL